MLYVIEIMNKVLIHAEHLLAPQQIVSLHSFYEFPASWLLIGCACNYVILDNLRITSKE